MACCSWCQRETASKNLTVCKCDEDEKHNLCSSCHLTGHACQSSCPSCWHYFAESFIINNCLCGGCFQPLNETKSIDRQGHQLCWFCQQCTLCLFRQQIHKEFFSSSYRAHEPRIQRILYLMQICVQQVEIQREPCSICMEPLIDTFNHPVRTLDACQHRFHSMCIEKWFKEKPCCPCCRHVYKVHDEPKSKRLRRNHPYIFHPSTHNRQAPNSPMDTF